MGDISKKIVLEEDTTKLASEIKKHASESKKEEDLKIRVESTLRPIFDRWGIQWASYEHTNHKISGKRKDALYGTVIIEYKAPGKLDSKTEFDKAKQQIKRYISQEAEDKKYYGKYFGVIIDGFKISFVRFRRNQWDEQKEALEINPKTILKFLQAIRGLKRKPIDAEELLIDFGPKSEISRKVILTLYRHLSDENKPRTDMLFNDWKRVFSQVCSYSQDKLKGLIRYYRLNEERDVDVEKLMFAVHTYYTLLMKLLTSEIVTLFADSLLGSYLKRLEETYYKSHKDMLIELTDLEEGGIFHDVGIRNFLEADYFAWYLDEWDEEIADSVFGIVTRLLDYEPATVELSPERVKDLFKRLYQNLVSRDVRHRLGEYYTPDWLAELLLDEINYHGEPNKKILDPACGSGTFLMSTIKRIREYADENFLDRRELVKNIIDNVKGIDLNPLAVLASKANYIIALSDLLRYRPKGGIELPIYLADSISVERKMTFRGKKELALHTTEGQFWITNEVIDKKLLHPVLSLIEECIKLEFTTKEFAKSLSNKIPLTRESINSFIRLYEKIYKLEYVFHKNRIWVSLLKNSFAPMLMSDFDYVIGNPPWINWETLPKFYRDSTKHLWGQYGLIGKGAFKRDIAMLFVSRCFDIYTKNNGKLAFLIPFTTYKTQAGKGFRNFLSDKCNVKKVHDLVELYPFEGAINRTSMLLIGKGKTTFPIPCKMWSNPRSRGMDMEAELAEVRKKTKQFDMILAPIDENKKESSWMIIRKTAYNVVKRIIKPSHYKAQEGVNTRGANGVFYVTLLDSHEGSILIQNNIQEGRKKYKQIKKAIDREVVYPLLRGRDIDKWYYKPSGHLLVPHNPKNGNVFVESQFKLNLSKSYSYFMEFKEELNSRSHYTNSIVGKFPFYTLFQVNSKTFAPFKVAWKYISGKISGKGEFSVAVINQINDRRLGQKNIVPNEKIIFVPADNESEAHYMASILNSSITQLVVMSYTIETQISTHVLKHVYVPYFNPKDPLHLKLSNLSKKAHDLTKQIRENRKEELTSDLGSVEDEIDKTVADLYGITGEELKEIKETLKILRGDYPKKEK